MRAQRPKNGDEMARIAKERPRKQSTSRGRSPPREREQTSSNEAWSSPSTCHGEQHRSLLPSLSDATTEGAGEGDTVKEEKSPEGLAKDDPDPGLQLTQRSSKVWQRPKKRSATVEPMRREEESHMKKQARSRSDNAKQRAIHPRSTTSASRAKQRAWIKSRRQRTTSSGSHGCKTPLKKSA